VRGNAVRAALLRALAHSNAPEANDVYSNRFELNQLVLYAERLPAAVRWRWFLDGPGPPRSAYASGEPAPNASASSRNGANVIGTTEDARKTCEMDRGWSGNRPSLVMRYETGDLTRLPGDLEQKIQNGRYRAATVGACDAGSSQGFTRFRVAVLLY